MKIKNKKRNLRKAFSEDIDNMEGMNKPVVPAMTENIK